MASWHDAQRMCLETFHGQSSLLDDPPVLIRATKTAGGANGWSASSPLTADLPPAAPTGPRTDGRGGPTAHLLPDRVYGEAGNGISFSHDNAVSEQSLSRTRSLTAEGV